MPSPSPNRSNGTYFSKEAFTIVSAHDSSTSLSLSFVKIEVIAGWRKEDAAVSVYGR